MKINKEEGFTPITLTLETQEEFDFLNGLLGAGEEVKKHECNYYSLELDLRMWELLENIR